MKTNLRHLLPVAFVASGLALSVAGLAQNPAPATPAIPAEAAAPVAAASAVAPTEKKEPEISRLDSVPADPSGSKPAKKGKKPQDKFAKDPAAGFASKKLPKPGDNAIVSVGHDSFLAKDHQADAVVSVLGSSTSEGEVADAVVSVLGDTRVLGGSVGDAAVAVLGNTYVNGKVGNAVVAILGDIELGPDAQVGAEVVSIGGEVKRDPKAVVNGRVQHVAFAGGHPRVAGLRTWFTECLLLGRPLALKPGLGWAWTIAVGMFALYFLLAVIFRGGVDRGVNTLETRPGFSILTAILSVLMIPLLIVLLAITIVGIVAIPFLVLGVFIAGLFGKTVMLAWLGRRFTKFFGGSWFGHAAVAVLVGGAITLGLYCVPFVGMIVQKSFDLIGLGVVMYALILAAKREKSPAPAVSLPVAPAPQPPIGVSAPPAEIPPAVAPAVFAPPVSAATAYPRAGFMIRLGALALDFILLGMVLAFFHLGGKFFLLALAGYGAAMWKLKGTTVGGIICGLKVVRVDGRELEWSTAIVRALGCFLSLAVVGLGFLWVAIDADRQSWHDKIAGTTVVRLPKGIPLV